MADKKIEKQVLNDDVLDNVSGGFLKKENAYSSKTRICPFCGEEVTIGTRNVCDKTPKAHSEYER